MEMQEIKIAILEYGESVHTYANIDKAPAIIAKIKIRENFWR